MWFNVYNYPEFVNYCMSQYNNGNSDYRFIDSALVVDGFKSAKWDSKKASSDRCWLTEIEFNLFILTWG